MPTLTAATSDTATEPQNGHDLTADQPGPHKTDPQGDGDNHIPANLQAASDVRDAEGNRSTDRSSTHGDDLSGDELVAIYRKMLLSRRLDEKMLIMLKQGKSFFHIGAEGHEAAQLALSTALKPGHDWFYPYYRDQALCLGLGMTTEEILLCFLAKAADPNSGGRQMPQHYGKRELNIVSQSSPTGTQYLQAVGCAMGAKREGTDQVVYVSSGEGTTSQGEFHEAMNWASREKLPVLFVIQDNKFAISVPLSAQTAGSIYDLGASYVNMTRFECDGTDFLATLRTAQQAVAHIRAGNGPVLLVPHVVRLLPHSSSDNHKKYRSDDDLASDRERDPLPKVRAALVKAGHLSDESANQLEAEVKEEVDRVALWADAQPFPEADTALLHVCAEDGPELEFESTTPSGEPIVLVDAINHAMAEEMARNPKMLIYGEDVAGGKGGVFTATQGLTAQFGDERVFNSPLAEASIVGTAIGLAVRGWKPCVEIQFGDYIWTAMMQIRDELATMRYRSNGAWSCPVVLRVPIGGYIHGALYHSQNIEATFAHIPGLKVVLPCTAADAKGLLKTALRSDDPVLFLEHKSLYRQGFAKSPEPDEDYLLPFGKLRVARPGRDLTVVTYGAMTQRCITAARQMAAQGVEVEVLDLRSILPYDKDGILESVKKTGKALVVHEDFLTMGFGAEIAAFIADAAFEHLDGPVRRVAGADAHTPYNWVLEEVTLPQEHHILTAMQELAAY